MKPSEIKNAFAPISDACFSAMMAAVDNAKEESVIKKTLHGIGKETFHKVYGISTEELDIFDVLPTFMTVNGDFGENKPFQKGDRLWSVS